MIRQVYIAGPYRGATAWEREQNIVRARQLGAEVVKLGAYPQIPHSNTAHMDGLAPDEFWLEATLEQMRRCDAVLFTPDWKCSTGARGEHAEAGRQALPVFYSLDGLRVWLESNVIVEVPA